MNTLLLACDHRISTIAVKFLIVVTVPITEASATDDDVLGSAMPVCTIHIGTDIA
jgi:hypothetical protein